MPVTSKSLSHCLLGIRMSHPHSTNNLPCMHSCHFASCSAYVACELFRVISTLTCVHYITYLTGCKCLDWNTQVFHHVEHQMFLVIQNGERCKKMEESCIIRCLPEKPYFMQCFPQLCYKIDIQWFCCCSVVHVKAVPVLLWLYWCWWLLLFILWQVLMVLNLGPVEYQTSSLKFLGL